MKIVPGFAIPLLLALLLCGCGASKNQSASSAAPPPPPNPNFVSLTVNSEPAGARVYQCGRLFGTTPCELVYPIDDAGYKSGLLKCSELVVVADGYLPQKAQPCFEIKPQWRPQLVSDENGAHFDGGKRYPYGHLFLLERDSAAASPKAPPAKAAPAKSNSDSTLDQAHKATSLMLMLKSLSGH